MYLIVILQFAICNDKIAYLNIVARIAMPTTKLYISLVFLCFANIVLSGCGTKGPLYIPEQRYPQAATQAAPQVASETSTAQPKTKE